MKNPMKKHWFRATLAAIVIALIGLTTSLHAQIQTTSYTNTFDTGGNTTFFTGGSVASWCYWYSIIGGNELMTNDPTMDAAGDTNVSGSLYCAFPFTGINEQQQVFGTFDNGGIYDGSLQIPLDLITNIAFDIHVQPGTPTDSSGNFGQITMSLVDPGWNNGGRVGNWSGITIPGAATNGWVHLQDSNLSNDIASMVLTEAGFTTPQTNAAGIGFYVQSYGGYPTNPITFWIDNVAVSTSSAPPPPPPPPSMNIFPAVAGLNLFTGSGATLYNRESLETTGNNYSWVGASGPVSYSFTITNYPVPSGDAVQNHIFLIPNPGTESAPDYAETNLIFFDLESTGYGAQWNFRYKTNEPQGNAMVYGVGTLASLNYSNAAGAVGTWKATFNQNTNVTMTAPDGTSTNFSIPDTTGATTALFSNQVVLYYGVQSGNIGGTADHIVASDFNVTGLGSADFDDNFVADNGTLNTGIWEVNAAFPLCVDLVGSGSPYWVQWTAPATGFGLVTSPTLTPPTTWTLLTNNSPFLAGTKNTELLSTNELPPGNTAFFSLVQRTFSQLLIVLPGQAVAPNTATGLSGTPTPVSISGQNGTFTFTVLAVDANFNPVSGVNDTLTFADADGGAYSAPDILANGSGQFTVGYAFTNSAVVITATDLSNTGIPAANSTPFAVVP